MAARGARGSSDLTAQEEAASFSCIVRSFYEVLTSPDHLKQWSGEHPSWVLAKSLAITFIFLPAAKPVYP